MTANQIASLFKARRFGDGKWRAKCPSHGSHGGTLSIIRRDNGRTSVKCFAGCVTEEILSTVGLKASDLFEASGPPSPEATQMMRNRERLGKLEHRHGWLIMAKAVEENKEYWERQIRTIEREIMHLRLSMDEWGPR